MHAPHVSMLLLKLTLSPLLIGVATVLIARFGARLGGVVTALPVVSGPVLLLFALEQGAKFTASAASSALLGTLALVAYTTLYAQVARRFESRGWIWICLTLGYVAFFVVSAVLRQIEWPRPVYAPLALVAVIVGLRTLPQRTARLTTERSTLPGAHLQLTRMAAAALLVWSLSEAADRLGPTWSGLLTAFPVVGTVVLVATHLDYGFSTALEWLRGFLLGLLGYIAFIACVAFTIERLGTGAAFALGLGSAVLTQVLVTRVGGGTH